MRHAPGTKVEGRAALRTAGGQRRARRAATIYLFGAARTHITTPHRVAVPGADYWRLRSLTGRPKPAEQPRSPPDVSRSLQRHVGRRWPVGRDCIHQFHFSPDSALDIASSSPSLLLSRSWTRTIHTNTGRQDALIQIHKCRLDSNIILLVILLPRSRSTRQQSNIFPSP